MTIQVVFTATLKRKSCLESWLRLRFNVVALLIRIRFWASLKKKYIYIYDYTQKPSVTLRSTIGTYLGFYSKASGRTCRRPVTCTAMISGLRPNRSHSKATKGLAKKVHTSIRQLYFLHRQLKQGQTSMHIIPIALNPIGSANEGSMLEISREVTHLLV